MRSVVIFKYWLSANENNNKKGSSGQSIPSFQLISLDRVHIQKRMKKESPKLDDLRFSVVLFPLSLCPRSNILISGLALFSFFSARSISSILSLTCLASDSAANLISRSAGLSFGGGKSAARSGSERDRRRFGSRGRAIVLNGKAGRRTGMTVEGASWKT